MLKNINTLLSPELLKILCEMGHGDEIVIADANFPSKSLAKSLVRADGIKGEAMLDAVLSVIPLDSYVKDSFVLMSPEPNDELDKNLIEGYTNILTKYEAEIEATYISRHEYYERAKKAYAVISTGEITKYANIILKKGVL
ncbi:MAG: L-fucose mutarotase [Oscillospiraceae bacterium]|jgi:L-fucose mutarotase